VRRAADGMGRIDDRLAQRIHRPRRGEPFRRRARRDDLGPPKPPELQKDEERAGNCNDQRLHAFGHAAILRAFRGAAALGVRAMQPRTNLTP